MTFFDNTFSVIFHLENTYVGTCTYSFIKLSIKNGFTFMLNTRVTKIHTSSVPHYVLHAELMIHYVLIAQFMQTIKWHSNFNMCAVPKFLLSLLISGSYLGRK